MAGSYLRRLRIATIATAAAMMVVSGHFWNMDKVHPRTLPWFDFMILMLILWILAIFMDGADERRKNVNAFVFLVAGVLSLVFVFS